MSIIEARNTKEKKELLFAKIDTEASIFFVREYDALASHNCASLSISSAIIVHIYNKSV